MQSIVLEMLEQGSYVLEMFFGCGTTDEYVIEVDSYPL